MASDADIDRMLLEHAARWQATIRTNASIDVGTFRGGASRGPFAVAMITVAAFGVVAAAVAVNSVGPLTPVAEPGSSRFPARTDATLSASTAPPNGLQDDVVGIGDVVVATGTLVATGPTEGFICTELAWAGEWPVCASSTGVPVRLNDDALGGQYVKVRGVWDGTSIEAREITPVDEPPPEPLPRIACRAPADGWPGQPRGDDGESVVRALETELLRHPALYVGMWSGVADSGGAAGDVRVLVVGTVGSVDAATDELAKVYPFNFCVVPVEFSADDLTVVVSSLSSFEFPWKLQLDPAIDRVVITTNALSQAMADALASLADRIELRTHVRRDG